MKLCKYRTSKKLNFAVFFMASFLYKAPLIRSIITYINIAYDKNVFMLRNNNLV